MAYNDDKQAGDKIKSADWDALVTALEDTTSGHDHDGTDSHTVDSQYVVVTPAGSYITSTNVQGALEELDSAIGNENLWDRTGTTVSLHNSGDKVALDGALEMSANSATFTHTGTTSLTISSTSGSVIIEGLTFTGDAVTGASSITSTAFVGSLTGNADTATLASTVTVADESSDTSCYLAFVTSATGSLAVKTGSNLTFNSSTGLLTATLFSDGTFSTSAGAFSGVVSITDGTASWSSNSLSGFTSISGTTLTDGTLSINGGQITSLTSISDGTATWSSNSLSGFTSISGTTITDGTASMNGGALSSVTTISCTGDITISGNTANITHSGTTSLTIASTSGYVAIETVQFAGGAISSVSSITDGTASWSSNSLSGFTSISGTTLTDGTTSISSGAYSGVVSITDGTASWSSNSLSGFTSISGTTLTDGTTSISSGAYSGVVSITDGTASWSSNSLSGFTSISGTTLTDGTLSISSGAVTSLVSISDGTASWSSSSLSGFTSITGTTIGDGTASINSGAISGVTTIGASGNITTTGGNVIAEGGTLTAGDTAQTGSLQLYDGSDHKITITSPSIAGDYTLTLPTTDGNASEFLQTDGSGNCSWVSGTVSNPFTLSGDPAVSAFDTDGELGYTGTEVIINDGGSVLRSLTNSNEWARMKINTGLTHYWKFDEESTSTASDYINADATYDLTGTSISAFVNGVAGGSAVDLDGSADYFSTSTLTDFADDTTGTISVWFYHDDLSAGTDVLLAWSDKDNDNKTALTIYANSSGELHVTCRVDDTVQWDAQVNELILSNWHHLVVTHNATRPMIYIDGAPVDITFDTSTDLTDWLKSVCADATVDADTFAIGSRVEPTKYYFDGKIDEVMYWNTALTAEEVRRLYASYNPERIAGLDNTPAQGVDLGEGLKLYYDFDGDHNIAPATILDKSGWGNHATSAGSMTSADWVAGKYGSALDFDNSDDVIYNEDIGFCANDTSGTIACWVKCNNADTGQSDSPWGFGNNSDATITNLYFKYETSGTNDAMIWICYVDGASKWQYYNNTSGQGKVSELVNKWVHVVVTHNGVSPKFYLNGVQITVTAIDETDVTAWITDLTAATHPANAVSVGGLPQNGGYANYWSGSLDEFRYYGRALSAEEVWALYNSTSPPQANMSSVSLTDGLSGYWSFDEYVATTYTSAYDYCSSPTKLTLTHTSAPTVAQGMYGLAPHYDGTADYTSGTMTNSAFAGDSVGAISCWIYMDDDPGSDETILSISDANTDGQTRVYLSANATGNYFLALIELDNTVQWNLHSTADAAFASYVGGWHHLVLVQDGVSPVLYVDGVEDTVFTVTTNKTKWITDAVNATNAADTLTVGAFANNSGFANYFDGKIDDVRIHSRPLTAKEVWNLYKTGGR